MRDASSYVSSMKNFSLASVLVLSLLCIIAPQSWASPWPLYCEGAFIVGVGPRTHHAIPDFRDTVIHETLDRDSGAKVVVEAAGYPTRDADQMRYTISRYDRDGGLTSRTEIKTERGAPVQIEDSEGSRYPTRLKCR
jgi:hypothetical protein